MTSCIPISNTSSELRNTLANTSNVLSLLIYFVRSIGFWRKLLFDENIRKCRWLLWQIEIVLYFPVLLKPFSILKNQKYKHKHKHTDRNRWTFEQKCSTKNNKSKHITPEFNTKNISPKAMTKCRKKNIQQKIYCLILFLL